MRDDTDHAEGGYGEGVEHRYVDSLYILILLTASLEVDFHKDELPTLEFAIDMLGPNI
ncbi:hypothetical protein NX059_002579 [Plenodomus lindquistii]|nr:hypothetical protein NX059_002579 [Plenodomus lindquistii]